MLKNPRMSTYPAKPSRSSAAIALAMLTTIAALLTGSRTVRAQCQTMAPPPTSAGTEFLLCFERNDVVYRYDSDSGYCEIDIATLDAPTTTVTITSRHYPTLNQVFTLGPRTSQTWR